MMEANGFLASQFCVGGGYLGGDQLNAKKKGEGDKAGEKRVGRAGVE